MGRSVITGMAIVTKDFIYNPSVIGIIVLVVVLLILFVVMFFLGRKLKKLKVEKQAVVQREIEEQREIQHQIMAKPKPKPIMHMIKIEPEKIDWDSLTSEQKDLFGKALEVMSDARRGGFSDLEIRNMFRERGWRDSDIERLIYEIRKGL